MSSMTADDNRVAARERLQRPVPRERRKVRGQVSELVVDDERCDRRFEDEEAQRRRDEWLNEQADRLKARQAVRRQMTLGQRLDVALTEIERGKGTRARPIATQRSTTDGSPSSRSQPHVSGPEIDHALKLIAHHVKTIERACDAERGLLRVEPVGDRPGHTGVVAGPDDKAGRMLTTAERDEIIWRDFQGIPAATVASEAPYLGKDARTIERARMREAAIRELRVDPMTGEVLGKVENAA
jgi:hypothetical protein